MISIVIVSKNEPALDVTLTHVMNHVKSFKETVEVIVVDASDGRLDYVQDRHGEEVRWLRFQPPPGVRVSIPHQRNVGVRAACGEVVVFTDAGCIPREGWLTHLVTPIWEGESVTAGLTVAAGDRVGLYENSARGCGPRYLKECATINLAFNRQVFDSIGGFDEGFAYGSDIDFAWRLVDMGYRILNVPEAVVTHDWGHWRRQMRRSYAYGRARNRLYRKHRARRRHILRDDPVVVIYPLFILGLPLVLLYPFYPLLLLIPAWRNRSIGPVRVIINHLIYGFGVLREFLN